MSTVRYGWHVHHNVLIERFTEPIEARAVYIRKYKPAHEVALRLRLLAEVKGELPAELIAADAAYEQAWAARMQAWKAYDLAFAARDQTRDSYSQALAAYEQACTTYDQACTTYDQMRAERDHLLVAREQTSLGAEIEALHQAECPDCPWNGETIFPEGRSHD